MFIPQSTSTLPKLLLRQFGNNNDQQDVFTCTSQGFHVGILGAVTALVLLIQSVFVLCGRSSIPPWSRSSKRGSLFWEVLKTAIILTSNTVSLAAGIWLLSVGCSVSDDDGSEDTGAGVNLWGWVIARVILAGIGGTGSMILGFRRIKAVRGGKDDIPSFRKTILTTNILMGIAGWCYLVPFIFMVSLATPELIAKVPIKLFSIGYWGSIVFVLLVLLFSGAVAKMTKIDSMLGNLVIAVVFLGGFACVIYSEVCAGLIWQTILLVPAADRAALSWAHIGGAMIAHWLMGG